MSVDAIGAQIVVCGLLLEAANVASPVAIVDFDLEVVNLAVAGIGYSLARRLSDGPRRCCC